MFSESLVTAMHCFLIVLFGAFIGNSVSMWNRFIINVYLYFIYHILEYVGLRAIAFTFYCTTEKNIYAKSMHLNGSSDFPTWVWSCALPARCCSTEWVVVSANTDKYRTGSYRHAPSHEFAASPWFVWDVSGVKLTKGFTRNPGANARSAQHKKQHCESHCDHVDSMIFDLICSSPLQHRDIVCLDYFMFISCKLCIYL